MLTHELKTPLSVIRIAIGTGASAQSTLIADARRAVDDMRAIIDRCVQADRLEEGSGSYAPQIVDFDEVLEQVTRDVQSRVVEERPNGPADKVHTDPTVLKMILSNLVDNAIKYCASNSAIMLRIEGDAQRVSIRVSNLPGAAGWPDPDRVFKKYYRSPGAHHETGSGLGLYLVSMLANLTGGAVRYAPTHSHVVFEFWIPRST